MILISNHEISICYKQNLIESFSNLSFSFSLLPLPTSASALPHATSHISYRELFNIGPTLPNFNWLDQISTQDNALVLGDAILKSMELGVTNYDPNLFFWANLIKTMPHLYSLITVPLLMGVSRAIHTSPNLLDFLIQMFDK